MKEKLLGMLLSNKPNSLEEFFFFFFFNLIDVGSI
jgi:hypothetical protein